MKQVVRIEIKRGTEGMQYTLLDQTVEFKEGSTLYKAHGNSGENIDMVVSMQELPDYDEPKVDGWYICQSEKCATMFSKYNGIWTRFREGDSVGHEAYWMELCETEADCVGGKGLRKV
jgi:hypothetical protein